MLVHLSESESLFHLKYFLCQCRHDRANNLLKYVLQTWKSPDQLFVIAVYAYLSTKTSAAIILLNDAISGSLTSKKSIGIEITIEARQLYIAGFILFTYSLNMRPQQTISAGEEQTSNPRHGINLS